MDTGAAAYATMPEDDFNSVEPEAGSSRVHTERLSSNGEVMGESGNASELLTRVELDLACSSEKLVNLSILMMNVATKESDFEVFASEENKMSDSFFEKALEFDLLSGILNSGVRELDNSMATLEAQLFNAREILASCEHLSEAYMVLEEKLHDSETSLEQSQYQLSEMKMQSAKFQTSLSCFGLVEENGNSDKAAESLGNDKHLGMNTKINMQTVEQQRHILRMLENSLARELDLDKKLTESRQNQDELTLRLHSSEEEVFCMEEEIKDVLERLLETDNAAEVFMGISKELLSRLQVFQFNLNGSIQRENELRSELENSTQQLKDKESTLQKLESSSAELDDIIHAQTNSLKDSLREAEDKLILANSEAFTLREKVGSLEKKLKESEFQLLNAKIADDDLYSQISQMESVVEDLKGKMSKAESRAESAEANLKNLVETNMELNEELSLLKGVGGTTGKVNLLESQLRESDIQLQHAVASAEASQEKQIMLYSAIGDMENVIEDLKSKVSKAENRAESAEDKCIILSENNAELNEELCFLRGRMECLQASLHQTEDTKMTTAMDIGIRTKVIASLVMQLATERDRLHKQITSLAKENKILVVKLQQTNKDPSVIMSFSRKGNGKDMLFPEDELTTSTTTRAKACKEEVTEVTATSFEVNKTKYASVAETTVGTADSTSGIETVRRIDAGMLNFKHLVMAMLILLISAVAAYMFQQHTSAF